MQQWSGMIPMFRVDSLPFIRKTVIFHSILNKLIDSTVNVDLYFIKSNWYLGCVRRYICDLKPSLCSSALTISQNFKTYSTWKVIFDENDCKKCHIDEFSDNLLFQQENYVFVESLQAMERPDFIGASGENTAIPLPQQTTVTSFKEDIETGKRKSEDAEELEKSGREKKRRGGGGKTRRPGERYIPPPQKRNLGVSFNQEHFSETSYYFEGGLRKVHPYYFDFKTYCKGRWIGKSLLEIFSSEFRAESVDYYKAAAKEGRIKLNEIPVEDLSITLRNNDHMRNTVHRHEPPVVGQPLKIIVDDGEVLVVDKPSSMPVHPCGRFRHNTVIFILGKERGITELHTVHRLDRLTSGVLLFARTLEMSKKLDTLVRERKVEKEYVCRVEGEFPEGELVCEQPILVVSFKVGLCRVDPKGKECRTVFQRLSYNGTTSVVRCLPLTGRTHQIRVHLQFLGFPILHDPIYGSCAWGPHRAKGGLVGMSDADLLKALMDEHRSKQSLYLLDLPDDGMSMVQETKRSVSGINKQAAQSNVTSCAFISDETRVLSQTEKSEVTQGSRVGMQDLNLCDQKGSEEVQKSGLARNSSGSCPTQNSDRVIGESNCLAPTPATSTDICKPVPPGTRDSLCSECKLVRPDPTEKELIMYLHALRYKGPDFEYSASQPDWAKEDWIEE